MDNPRAQSGSVKLINAIVHRPFMNSQGQLLNLYELQSMKEFGGMVQMRFRRIGESRSFLGETPKHSLSGRGIKGSDIRAAPSFVVRSNGTDRIVEFISARNRRIDTFIVTRPAGR